jgi:sulfide:quinone oxidoreductase
MKILILGGGVGGIVAATQLRKRLPDAEITIVEKRDRFVLGATKTWVMLGERSVEQVSHPLDALKNRGIRVQRSDVLRIDAAARKVETTAGPLEGDHLILALGVDLNLEAIAGAHTFYTLEGAVKLGEVLKGFPGGEVVIVNPKMPIKCPPAPYEVAMHLDHLFKERGIRAKTKISFHTTEGLPMPTAGPEIGKLVKGELTKRDISFHPQRKFKSISGGRAVFEDGEAGFDLCIAVPPHEAPKVARDTGLTNASGWIPVDPKTLRTAVDRVWAIGDVTAVPLPGRYKPDSALSLPKAAVFAEAHAKAVAAQIAGAKEGFDGRGFCWVETGAHHAMGGEGAFFETPAPQVVPTAVDKSQFQKKVAWADGFVKEYLTS